MATKSPAEFRKLDQACELVAIYQAYPEIYARQVLKQTWWEKQIEVARALVEHRRVLVKASHSVGKTHLAGGLVNWFFDCFAPSITLTTAPTQTQVQDLLWKEVRVQRGNRAGLQPKAPRLERAPNHFAAGYTARDANAFQGRHEEHVLIVFDEATGVGSEFWTAAEGMLTGAEHCYWLCIFNPTDTASPAYQHELEGGWHVVTIPATAHPNVAADLGGCSAPFPAAVRAMWIAERVRRWCTPISSSERQAGDIEWPPASGEWHRPGPLFESRVLGRWPSQLTTSVWSEGMWLGSLTARPVPNEPLEIGCDVARFGDDYTSIVARRGRAVLHHETHNGWSTGQVAGGLKALAKRLVSEGEPPERVAIKVDDDGVGGGVVDQAGGFNFVLVSAGATAIQSEDYPNRRSELWFTVADRAQAGDLDLSRLSTESRSLIRRQLMSPTWKMDSRGRRVVEPKADTKKRLGRSPDDADGLNMAFASGTWAQNTAVLDYLRVRSGAPA